VALPLMAAASRRASRQKDRRVIERQLAILRRLVNDLQDAERARRGALRLEPSLLDLRSIVADASPTLVRSRGSDE
jgi:hypothetical protein